MQEAQDIAEDVLDAEARIGELLYGVPPESGKRAGTEPPDSAVGRLTTGRETSRGMLLPQKYVEDKLAAKTIQVFH